MLSLAEQSVPAASSIHFEYLRRIEHALFPLVVTDPDEMTDAESLRLAGMILIGDGSTGADGDQFTYQRVVVREITLLGRAELRRRQKLSPWDWKERREG